MNLRSWTLALSAGCHAFAFTLLLAWSVIHVDELPTPRVRVTFFSIAGPPPPPPPPPGKETAHAIKARRVVRAKLPSTRTEAIPDDDDAKDGEETGESGGESGGVQGGQIGGVLGGVLGGILGGTGIPAPQPREPQTIPSGQVQVVYGAIPPYLDEAKAAGIRGVVTAKICVTATGTVSSVAIVRGLRMLDDSVTKTVKTWRYKPWIVDDRARPFCHVAQFAFDLD